jgi:ankyrin repeat protein
MFFGLFDDGKRNQRLLDAAKAGQLDLVNKLLSKKADVNHAEAGSGATALHLAAMEQHASVVSALLKHGADVNLKTLSGRTPLLLAIAGGDKALATVDCLLNGGAEIEAGSAGDGNGGDTPLFMAVSQGANRLIDRLISGGASTRAVQADGSTLLHAAAHGGDAETVRLILRFSDSIDVRRQDGDAPLHVAARVGNVAAVSALVDSGALIDAPGTNGFTALALAVKSNRPLVVECLLARGADVAISYGTGASAGSPMQIAALHGYDDIVQMLIKAGASMEASEVNGKSALALAKAAGQASTVAILTAENKRQRAIAKSIQNDLEKNEALWSDIIDAICHRDMDKVRELVKARRFPGLNVDRLLLVKSLVGTTAEITQLVKESANPSAMFETPYGSIFPLLMVVVHGPDIGRVRTLLDLGADINQQGANGDNALIFAVTFGKVETVQLLLERGADANTIGAGAMTVLQVAVKDGHGEVIKLLLTHGASVNHAMPDGRTALIQAASKGDMAICDLLLGAGADINAIGLPTRIGAFGAALDQMHMELVKHLLGRGAKPEFGDIDTLCLAVVEHGDMELVNMIEAAGGSVMRDDMLTRIACVAAHNHDGAVLDHVLSRGAGESMLGEFGYTRLIFAALTNHPELVKKYLAQGDDASAFDIDHETALSLAIENEHADVIAALRAHHVEERAYPGISDTEAMLVAAKDGALGTMLNLRDAGVSINGMDGEGNTPIMLASQVGNLGVVRTLFHLGADVNHRNHAGISAAGLAQSAGREDVLATLREFRSEDASRLLAGDDYELGVNVTLWNVGDQFFGRLSRPLKEHPPYEPRGDDDDDDDDDDDGYDENDEDSEDDESEPDQHSIDEVRAALSGIEAMFRQPEIGGKLSEDDLHGVLEAIEELKSNASSKEVLEGFMELTKLLEHLAPQVSDDSKQEDEQEESDALPPIFVAAAEGKLAAFRKILKTGVPIDTVRSDGTTLLMIAAAEGQENIVKELIKLGVDVNQARDDSFSALAMACSMEHESIVLALLDASADVNARYLVPSAGGVIGNTTALIMAAARGNYSVCAVLLEHGADVNAMTDGGYTALMFSLMRNGNEELAKLFLNACANPDPDVVATVDFGTTFTPLTLAASNGHVAMVRELIKRKVRLDLPSGDGWTALKHAANGGDIEIGKLLLKANATVDLADAEGWTALRSAVSQQHEGFVKMLLAAGANPNYASTNDDPDEFGRTSLMDAASIGDLAMVKLLVKAGADINQQSRNGSSPLGLSVFRRLAQGIQGLMSTDDGDHELDDDLDEPPSLDVFDFLLSKGCDPNVLVLERCLLALAQFANDKGVTRRLLKNGAVIVAPPSDTKVSESDARQEGDEQSEDEVNTDDDALVRAAVFGNTQAIATLIAGGEDIDRIVADGYTTLETMLARMLSRSITMDRRERRDCEQVIDCLLNLGARVDTANKPLFLALEVGARSDELHLFNAMIRHGADLSLGDPGRGTVLHFAATTGLQSVVGAVLDRHPELVDTRDGAGLTPLMWAAGNGHKEVVRSLLGYGADPALLSMEVLTAANYASNSGFDEVAVMLGK